MRWRGRRSPAKKRIYKPFSRHDQLLAIVQRLPDDDEPFGEARLHEDPDYRGDCSCGCIYFLRLEGHEGTDWGVCTNPKSHRVGLLTFEHQGCLEFEPPARRGKV